MHYALIISVPFMQRMSPRIDCICVSALYVHFFSILLQDLEVSMQVTSGNCIYDDMSVVN